MMPVDVDTGPPRGLGVAADGVDVPAVTVRFSTKVQMISSTPTRNTAYGMPRDLEVRAPGSVLAQQRR